jgi:L-asparaginase
MTESVRPPLLLLTTGGTIQGAGASRTGQGEYRIGTTPVARMLEAVPELASVADLTVEEIANVDSVAMTLPILAQLVARIRQAVAAANPPRGIVVTHGTDTLEESAYLLHLTVGAKIPVVLTAAMRPTTELGADGSVNLWNAVRTALCPESAGRGVLVAINERIHCPREVIKFFAQGVDAFQSPGAGPLGRTDSDAVRYYRRPERRCGAASEFAGLELAELPRVEIVAAYQEADGAACAAAVAAGARGLVLVGPLSPVLKAAAREAASRGVAVVVCHRGAGGAVRIDSDDRDWGLCSADDLSAAKARVLLRLALGRGVKAGDLPRVFGAY